MSGVASGDLAIAVCDRCRFKVPYKELRPDGNSPKLRVCRDCWDSLDPYRLPVRKEEAIVMEFPRPDALLNNTDVGIALQGENEIYVLTEDGYIVQVS